MQHKKKKTIALFSAAAILGIPVIAYASGGLSLDSIGRFEYDTNNDGTPDVVLDAGDIKALNAENSKNSDAITELQNNYQMMQSSLSDAVSKLNELLSIGDATADNVSKGKTVLVNGQTVTGTGADNDTFYNNGYTDAMKSMVFNMSYAGEVQTFTAPIDATYSFDCYGGSGGGTVGGKGGYTYIEYTLTKGQTIYICVGGQGGSQNNTGGHNGGYNGGGNGGDGSVSPISSIIGNCGSGGGGATSITLINKGVLANFSAAKDKVLAVAGGGGGYAWGTSIPGGIGGGLSGTRGQTTLYVYPTMHAYMGTEPSPGTQTSGYAFGTGQSGRNGGVWSCGAEGNGGGGGGWYGGCSSVTGGDWTNCSGGGGSGYISSLAQNGKIEAGVNTGDGKVVIKIKDITKS